MSVWRPRIPPGREGAVGEAIAVGGWHAGPVHNCRSDREAGRLRSSGRLDRHLSHPARIDRLASRLGARGSVARPVVERPAAGMGSPGDHDVWPRQIMRSAAPAGGTFAMSMARRSCTITTSIRTNGRISPPLRNTLPFSSSIVAGCPNRSSRFSARTQRATKPTPPRPPGCPCRGESVLIGIENVLVRGYEKPSQCVRFAYVVGALRDPNQNNASPHPRSEPAAAGMAGPAVTHHPRHGVPGLHVVGSLRTTTCQAAGRPVRGSSPHIAGRRPGCTTHTDLGHDRRVRGFRRDTESAATARSGQRDFPRHTCRSPAPTRQPWDPRAADADSSPRRAAAHRSRPGRTASG